MITLVGCGFLGSLFAEEMAKRQFAFDDTTEWRLIDFDKVSRRNAANQNFTLKDDGMYKVDVLGERLLAYDLHLRGHATRLDKSNTHTLLEGSSVIISAVDNYPTRKLLWYYAKQYRIPLLHLGVSQSGTGNTEWTIGKHDSWSLSPLATIGQDIENAENIPKELKPCELIAFRGLGLNTAVAAAKALGLFMGFDPEKVVNEKMGYDVLPGAITVWDSTNTGHSLRAYAEVSDGE